MVRCPTLLVKICLVINQFIFLYNLTALQQEKNITIKY